MSSEDYRDLHTMKPGEARAVDGKLWGRCGDCRRILRMDGFLGGVHICVDRLTSSSR